LSHILTSIGLSYRSVIEVASLHLGIVLYIDIPVPPQ